MNAIIEDIKDIKIKTIRLQNEKEKTFYEIKITA